MTAPNNEFLTAVLAVAPHPDDAELYCSGLLLTMAERGHTTAIVDITRGELSSRGDLNTRAEETAAASAVLGLNSRHNLDLPDGYLGLSAPLSGEWMHAGVELLRRLRPELVVLPYWEERHPDHIATSKLFTEAVFWAGVRKFNVDSGPAFTPRQVLYYPVRYEFKPSFVIDISAVAARKYQAIGCYDSQISAKQPGAATLLSSPLSLAAIEARDRYFGAMIGTTHGEGYLVRNMLRIDDPLTHFRIHDLRSSLLFPAI